MPWIVPSHQAPAVLLKLWKPRWFACLGLCLGSMAPDLENIFRLTQRELFGASELELGACRSVIFATTWVVYRRTFEADRSAQGAPRTSPGPRSSPPRSGTTPRTIRRRAS